MRSDLHNPKKSTGLLGFCESVRSILKSLVLCLEPVLKKSTVPVLFLGRSGLICKILKESSTFFRTMQTSSLNLRVRSSGKSLFQQNSKKSRRLKGTGTNIAGRVDVTLTGISYLVQNNNLML